MPFQFCNPILIAAISLLLAANSQAQSKFDSKLLTNGKYTLACYTVNGGSESAIGTFTIGVNTTNDKLSLTTITALSGLEEWKDTSISDLSTFKPIYRASHNSMKDMVLHFGKDVTGYYVDKKTGKKNQVKEAGDQYFVDSYTYHENGERRQCCYFRTGICPRLQRG
ncbi:hypothetical protein [Chitinophaga sp. GbtcB8]|uniref:DUF3108 domain-containing protein n=1 Tax=Chitinophaga sp. GbtcB8 TaxID=2824753 RepID=UPI001C2FF333|nr:hypothetical protein [Chitinophaga sp. GbtcB8]